MVDLDNPQELKKLDPKNVIGSTGMFVSQCRQIWELAQGLEFPKEYESCQNIVVCGMGGSAYGGYVASSLFKNQLKVPLVSNNDYHLPQFSNTNTLVILSSYSGGTEEILSCQKQALEKGLKITGIASAGILGEFLKSNNGLIFDPKFNPSGQPRLGMGYMVLGILGILNQLGFISISDDEMSSAIKEVKENQDQIKNRAEQLAKKIYGSIPIYFAAEFLSGNAHIIRNQSNETAKSFASFSLLSELNHHLMEGLKNPPDKKLFVLFLSSDLYSDRLKKRVDLTKDVVRKNNVQFDEIKADGSSKLSQVLNVLSFGGYLTFYLAMLYEEDPSVIPWVDYFKGQLEK